MSNPPMPIPAIAWKKDDRKDGGDEKSHGGFGGKRGDIVVPFFNPAEAKQILTCLVEPNKKNQNSVLGSSPLHYPNRALVFLNKLE